MNIIDTIISFFRIIFGIDSSKPTVKLDGNINLVIEEKEVIVEDKDEIKEESKKVAKKAAKKVTKKKTSKKKAGKKKASKKKSSKKKKEK